MLSDLFNDLMMLPYVLSGPFKDGDRPYDFFLENTDNNVSFNKKKALLAASDSHFRVFRTRQFLDITDKVYDSLASMIGCENIVYLRGDYNLKRGLKDELRSLALIPDAEKWFVYVGHGFRQPPFLGDSAKNPFLSSKDFLDLISGDDSPWITFFDNCFSGLFARNVSQRPLTLAVSSNTDLTTAPFPRFLPLLFSKLSSGHDILSAFRDASQDVFDNSFDYLTSEINLPDFVLSYGRKLDSLLKFSKASKQLYSNSINPEMIYLKK